MNSTGVSSFKQSWPGVNDHRLSSIQAHDRESEVENSTQPGTESHLDTLLIDGHRELNLWQTLFIRFMQHLQETHSRAQDVP